MWVTPRLRCSVLPIPVTMFGPVERLLLSMLSTKLMEHGTRVTSMVIGVLNIIGKAAGPVNVFIGVIRLRILPGPFRRIHPVVCTAFAIMVRVKHFWVLWVRRYLLFG